MNRLDDPTFDDIAVIGRWAGYGLLFLALPIALFAAMMLPNEYEAMGFSGIDCDGPLHVFMFAYPAFAIYGAAAIAKLLKAWNRRSVIVAALCLLVCVAITPNFVVALAEQRDNDTHHSCE